MSASVDLRRYTLAAKAVGWGVVAKAAGRAAALTTHARMFAPVRRDAGLLPIVVEDLEHANGALTRLAHRARLRMRDATTQWDASLGSEQSEWHTHPCLDCGRATTCYEDCEPGDVEAQLSGRVFEPRTCEHCADQSAAA